MKKKKKKTLDSNQTLMSKLIYLKIHFLALNRVAQNIFRSLNVNTKGTLSLTTETDACARANLGFDDFDVNITILRKSFSDAKIKES